MWSLFTGLISLSEYFWQVSYRFAMSDKIRKREGVEGAFMSFDLTLAAGMTVVTETKSGRGARWETLDKLVVVVVIVSSNIILFKHVSL